MSRVFEHRDSHLWVEDLMLEAIAAEFSTPCYVYSRAAIRDNYLAYADALREHHGTVSYAVKANGNLAVLQTLAALGAGFDIVSGGELARVLQAGGDPSRIVFSGVGKTPREMARALQAGIGCFNVESVAELRALDAVARELNMRAPVALRVNPDIDARTHPYIATGLAEHKFGIPIDDSLEVFDEASRLTGIDLCGVACHIGSQIFELDAFDSAASRMAELAGTLQTRGTPVRHVDLGGGLAIGYGETDTPGIGEYVARLLRPFEGTQWRIGVEPGRSIVGAAGCLLTRILYVKPGRDKCFAVVDAAMNDLLRPALYGAVQPVVNVHLRPDEQRRLCDVVGPVCESADFLGRDRELTLAPGELLAVLDAGAYSFAMSSQYNGRPRVAEVMVDGATAHLVRARETEADLFAGERLLPQAG